MNCKVTNFQEKDSFITKLENSDETLLKFYQYNPVKPSSFDQRMDRPNNGREQQLAQVIKSYMSDLNITEIQQTHLTALSEGAKVVIGGQQAGLFGGPLYTFHKILSIVNLSRELTETYQQTVVPVFWIAGEDHDFEEVNHTYAYNAKDAQLHKVKYHTMTPPETSVSRYIPEKEQMIEALNQFFKELKETKHTNALYQVCLEIIEKYNNWTDIFKGLLQEVFKDYGVLFIDAQYEKIRELEKPLLKNIIQKHNEINQAFRKTQKLTTQSGLNKMIETDTNVHLFLHEDSMRQLITKKDDVFKLSKSDITYNKDELLKLVEKEPTRFSNNVVTRPVMEEWLFNTVAFIGGPSEIKYWAELNEVFKILDVEMPIVLPRMKITYLPNRIEKLINQYKLNAENVIMNGIETDREKFVRSKASDTFIKKVESLKENHAKIYESLRKEVNDNHDNINLLKKNYDIHNKQFEYLLNRYLLNIERDNDISMKHFREIEHVLHPMGGLQERIWNPLQMMNEFGIDVFSPSTYPPLKYTFNQIVIKP